ncbi:MAG: multiple antibiotic resistance protein [Nonlabens sp.]
MHAEKTGAMDNNTFLKFFTDFNFKETFTAGMILFAVIDIIGSIPIIVDLRRKVGHVQSEKASIVAGILMIVFMFVGESMLGLIGIDVNSFAVAGAFIIFFIALEMILGIQLYKDDAPETAAIIPIAFPLIAGAGTLTSVLSLRSEYAAINIIIAIIFNIVFVYIVLKNSGRLEKLFGKQGINVIRKIFGVILLAIAVKLFTSNIKELF